MAQNELKPAPWRLGAKARLHNQGKDTNPFPFFGASNPQGNEPWSHWNHGWSWADACIGKLRDAANRGLYAEIDAGGAQLKIVP